MLPVFVAALGVAWAIDRKRKSDDAGASTDDAGASTDEAGVFADDVDGTEEPKLPDPLGVAEKALLHMNKAERLKWEKFASEIKLEKTRRSNLVSPTVGGMQMSVVSTGTRKALQVQFRMDNRSTTITQNIGDVQSMNVADMLAALIEQQHNLITITHAAFRGTGVVPLVWRSPAPPWWSPMPSSLKLPYAPHEMLPGLGETPSNMRKKPPSSNTWKDHATIWSDAMAYLQRSGAEYIEGVIAGWNAAKAESEARSAPAKHVDVRTMVLYSAAVEFDGKDKLLDGMQLQVAATATADMWQTWAVALVDEVNRHSTEHVGALPPCSVCRRCNGRLKF